jgi:threonine dehydrogenase-like Zn-dependent dehydrogenase
MRKSVFLALGVGAMGLMLLGCSSLRGPHQAYLAPRVVGRVVDARTGAPVPNARVRHVQQTSPSAAEALSDQRGAQRLLQTTGVQTDRQGWFNLPAQKGLFLLFGHGSGWFGTIVVEHPAYQTLRTNVTVNPAASTQSRRGPAVDAGDLMLEPKVSRPRSGS